jgi:Transposase domain (DUF772)
MLWKFRQPTKLSRYPLSLRPRSGEQDPPLTAQVAQTTTPVGTTAIWVRDRWTGCCAKRTSPTGTRRTGVRGFRLLSWLLSAYCSSCSACRTGQAAEAVRCRIDFKYAMAVELDDPGFHHSVPADFRDRLAEDDRTDRRLLEHLYRHGADHTAGPRVQALLQILAQNHHRDAPGHLRWRTAEKRDGGRSHAR